MSNLPTDPMILLSFVNTKLRDEYKDFKAMCDDMELDASQLKQSLLPSTTIIMLSLIDFHNMI